MAETCAGPSRNGSEKVKKRSDCPTTGNNMNNPLGAVLVPSVTNVFFTYRAEARGARPLDTVAVAELAMDTRLVGVLGDASSSFRIPSGGQGVPERAGREKRLVTSLPRRARHCSLIEEK